MRSQLIRAWRCCHGYHNAKGATFAPYVKSDKTQFEESGNAGR